MIIVHQYQHVVHVIGNKVMYFYKIIVMQQHQLAITIVLGMLYHVMLMQIAQLVKIKLAIVQLALI